MARVLIYTAAYLLELPEDSKVSEEDILRKTYILDNDVENQGDIFHWVSGTSGFYDTEKDNIGKCSVCGAWTTDSDGKNTVNTVSYGAKVDGLLFCDEHLPLNHHRAFYSSKKENDLTASPGQGIK